MTKENQVVTDVKNVVGSIRKKIQKKDIITLEDIDNLSINVNKLITNYEATREDYRAMNSLVMKHEKFKEVIGIIEYASASDEEILDQTIESLTKIFNHLKQK